MGDSIVKEAQGKGTVKVKSCEMGRIKNILYVLLE